MGHLVHKNKMAGVPLGQGTVVDCKVSSVNEQKTKVSLKSAHFSEAIVVRAGQIPKSPEGHAQIPKLNSNTKCRILQYCPFSDTYVGSILTNMVTCPFIS